LGEHFSHRFAFHFDAVSRIDEPVHHRIGNGIVLQIGMPLFDRQLCRNDGRTRQGTLSSGFSKNGWRL